MKKYILSIFTLVTIQAFSQEVLISNPNHPTSHLAMNGNVKGFHLPNVALENTMSKAPFENVTEGLLVYNTNPNVLNGNGIGIYIFIDNKWIRSGENADHNLIKDYKQVASIDYNYNSNSIVSPEIQIANKTFTRQGECEPRSEEDYTRKYCLFKSEQAVNWNEAYTLSRNENVNGYLPIITSQFEQQNFNSFLQRKGVESNIWLGIRKVNHTNTVNVESEYITPNYNNLFGQGVSMEWSNRPQKFHNFGNLEPNNYNRQEGCVMMLGKGLGVDASGAEIEQGKWIDYTCSSTNYTGTSSTIPGNGDFKYIVIEVGLPNQ